MSLYRRLVRPVLFRTDPEWAHDRSIRFAELASRSELTRRAVARQYVVHDERLALKLAGLAFRSPLGLAAGYDKNGRAVPLLSAFGFGHVEVGSVSAQRSAGNPAPRLFRLPRDNAIVVHYGVPNDGAVRVAERLAAVRRTVPVGINLVNTNRGPAAPVEPDEAVIADYVESVRLLQDRADYLCLNLSCPNTNDGSGFFHDPRRLSTLLEALDEVGIGKPVFLKVAPFATVGALEAFLEAAARASFVSGFSVNLPPAQPAANRTIRELYRRMDRDRYVIIGSGGVFTAEDAYRKIRLGASLVQLLTSLIYQGPEVVRSIHRRLPQLLERDGFAHVREVIGIDVTV